MLVRMRRVSALAATLVMFLVGTVNAAENAFGTYLLGVSGPQAGMMPPTSGVFSSYNVFTWSAASPTVAIPVGGNLVVDVKATIVLGSPTLLWVPDVGVLGGRVGVYALVPIGSVALDVNGTLTPPVGPPIAGGVFSERVSVGDPQIGGLIGWNNGPFHWSLGTLINIPVGDYKTGAIDNLAFHRWSYDFHGGLTWLDPTTGFELSGRAGITVNETNPDTDYKTGEEFHIEFAALVHLSQQLNTGLVGYHYQQISGDSGSGAVLGPFKGRVTALGPHISWTFPVGQVPVSLTGRAFVEFNTKNRLQDGVSGLFTLSIPLHVSGSPPGAPAGPPPQ